MAHRPANTLDGLGGEMLVAKIGRERSGDYGEDGKQEPSGRWSGGDFFHERPAAHRATGHLATLPA